MRRGERKNRNEPNDNPAKPHLLPCQTFLQRKTFKKTKTRSSLDLPISDGTGFGYGCYCLVGWYRGMVTKKVKRNCKVMMVWGDGRERMVLGVKVESCYAEMGMFLDG